MQRGLLSLIQIQGRDGGKGGAMEDWIHAHAHGVLLGIEVMWVGGFLAVFVVYFFIRRWVKRQPKQIDSRKDASG